MKNKDDDWEEFLKQREKEKQKEEIEASELLALNNNNNYNKVTSFNTDFNNSDFVNEPNNQDEGKDLEENDYDEDDTFEEDETELNKTLAEAEELEKQVKEMLEARKKTQEQEKTNKTHFSPTKEKLKPILLLSWLGICFLTIFIGSGFRCVPAILFGFFGFAGTIILMAIISGKKASKNANKLIEDNLNNKKPITALVVSCNEISAPNSDKKVYKVLVTFCQQNYYAICDRNFNRYDVVKINILNQEAKSCIILTNDL